MRDQFKIIMCVNRGSSLAYRYVHIYFRIAVTDKICISQKSVPLATLHRYACGCVILLCM